MSYDINFYYQHGVATLSCFGELDVEDLKHGINKLCCYHDFNEISNMVIDLSSDPVISDSPDTFRSYAESVAGKLKMHYKKIAIIAPKDLTFGMLRMYTALEDDKVFGIFREKESVCKWLEVDFFS